MLTKISQLFVSHQKMSFFTYIRQAYDPAYGTGSPACRGKAPGPLGGRDAPSMLCIMWHTNFLYISLINNLSLSYTHAYHVLVHIMYPCISCTRAYHVPMHIMYPWTSCTPIYHMLPSLTYSCA